MNFRVFRKLPRVLLARKVELTFTVGSSQHFVIKFLSKQLGNFSELHSTVTWYLNDESGSEFSVNRVLLGKTSVLIKAKSKALNFPADAANFDYFLPLIWVNNATTAEKDQKPFAPLDFCQSGLFCDEESKFLNYKTTATDKLLCHDPRQFMAFRVSFQNL